MRRFAVTAVVTVAAGAAALAACNSVGGPSQEFQVAIVATDSLDGYVRSDSTGSATGGGPVTGDLDGIAGDSGKGYRQLYSFDLSAIPATMTLDSAFILLYQARASADPFAKLGPVIVDHVNYGATFPTDGFYLPALESDIGTLSTDTTTTYRVLDVTNAVAGDLAAGRPRSQYRVRFSLSDGNGDTVSDFVQFGDAERSCCTPDSVPLLRAFYHRSGS